MRSQDHVLTKCFASRYELQLDCFSVDDYSSDVNIFISTSCCQGDAAVTFLCCRGLVKEKYPVIIQKHFYQFLCKFMLWILITNGELHLMSTHNIRCLWRNKNNHTRITITCSLTSSLLLCKRDLYRYFLTFKDLIITKTCLFTFDSLKPHVYIVKLGFTGVYIIFLILLKNIDFGQLLEPPRRGGSNEYPQSMF